MSDQYEVEVLLRPAVEVYSVLVCTSAALLLVLAPSLVLMPTEIAYGCAAVMLNWAVIDMWKVHNVWRYRVGMRSLPKFAIGTDEIPQKEGSLFVGKGFEWEQKHTQRLMDTLSSRYRKYAVEPSIIDWLYGYFRGNKSFDLGGNPMIHGVESNEKDLFVSQASRRNHTIVFGVPGSGKTRNMEMLVAQDIRRNPESTVIIFDPKGDADLLRRVYIEAAAAGRLDDVTTCLLGVPEVSARYNSVGQFSRITEVATRLANQLPGEGNASAFRDFAWRFLNIVAKALYGFGQTINLEELQTHMNDVEPLFVRVVDKAVQEDSTGMLQKALAVAASEVPAELPRAFAGRSVDCYVRYKLVEKYGQAVGPIAVDLAAVIKYDKTYYDKLVSNIGPLLEKLTTGMAAELISPDYFDLEDPRPMFTWEQVIRRRGIVYIGLDALSDMTVSAAWGGSMIADLVAVAGRIYKQGIHTGTPGSEGQGEICLHADELNELVGPEFTQMVNKCRGAGIVVTAYTQAVADLQSGLGDVSKAEQLIGNFGNKIFMRVPTLASAKLMTDTLPVVRIKTVMAVSGVNDSNDMLDGSHFDSRNEDRISEESTPLLNASELQGLPIGQAFAQLDGGRIFKLRVPLLEDPKGALEMPDSISGIVDKLKNQQSPNAYITPETPWWPGGGFDNRG